MTACVAGVCCCAGAGGGRGSALSIRSRWRWTGAVAPAEPCQGHGQCLGVSVLARSWARQLGMVGGPETIGGLRQRRCGRSAGRQRWDRGRRGRRPGDERGHGRPAWCAAGSSGGGQQPKRAVRILHWAWLKRCQTRSKERSLRWERPARLAAMMPWATACCRKRHREVVVRRGVGFCRRPRR